MSHPQIRALAMPLTQNTLPLPDTKNRSLVQGHDLRRVRSDIRAKGRWTPRIFQKVDNDRSIADAFGTINRVANAVPLDASLKFPSPSVEVPRVEESKKKSPGWYSVLTSASPTEDAQKNMQYDGNLSANYFNGSTEVPISSVPTGDGPSILRLRTKKIPEPIVIPNKNDNHSPMPIARLRQLQPVIQGAPLYSSPVPLTQGIETSGLSTLEFVGDVGRLGTIVGEIQNLDSMVRSIYPAPMALTQSTIDSWHTASQGDPERKMLIIGSNYDNRSRNPSISYTYASHLGSLTAARNDADELKSIFQKRGYSVQTMIREDFDRVDMLERVASFLEPAILGDVRAIVFTGHSIKLESDGQSAIVPPRCNGQQGTIPALDWNENIRKHTKSGVIVLSIFATCWSAGLAQQGIRITDFNQPQDTRDISLSRTPILITFSSCGLSEQSYESSISSSGCARDHFLWALVMTARSDEIHSWDQFVVALKTNFLDVRSRVSKLFRSDSGHSASHWSSKNPQNPVLTFPSGNPPKISLIIPGFVSES